MQIPTSASTITETRYVLQSRYKGSGIWRPDMELSFPNLYAACEWYSNIQPNNVYEHRIIKRTITEEPLTPEEQQ